jgi:CopG family transcriptional regulator, nickel-responsive regulator
MQRITITIDDELALEIDKLAQSRGYQNRSETVRDLVRAGIVQTQHNGRRAAECVASVVYVYDQGTRELPKWLAHAYQEQHDLSVATVRVALDHDTCMEVAVLKGKTAEVERFAEPTSPNLECATDRHNTGRGRKRPPRAWPTPAACPPAHPRALAADCR